VVQGDSSEKQADAAAANEDEERSATVGAFAAERKR
jgi:hypothetical protein